MSEGSDGACVREVSIDDYQSLVDPPGRAGGGRTATAGTGRLKSGKTVQKFYLVSRASQGFSEVKERGKY